MNDRGNAAGLAAARLAVSLRLQTPLAENLEPTWTHRAVSNGSIVSELVAGPVTKTLELFEGTVCRRRASGRWEWQNHDGMWEPVLPDSVIAIAIAAEVASDEEYGLGVAGWHLSVDSLTPEERALPAPAADAASIALETA